MASTATSLSSSCFDGNMNCGGSRAIGDLRDEEEEGEGEGSLGFGRLGVDDIFSFSASKRLKLGNAFCSYFGCSVGQEIIKLNK